MVTRVQWTMDDFKEIYARYKESGLTIKDFCSNEGIKRKRFSFWKAKLKGPKTNAAAKGKFIPVNMGAGGHALSGKTPAPASFFSPDFPSSGQPQSVCEIVYPNGVTVRLNGPVSSEILQTLIFLNLNR